MVKETKKQVIKKITNYLGEGGCIGFEHGYVYPEFRNNRMTMIDTKQVYLMGQKILFNNLLLSELQFIYNELIKYEKFVYNTTF